MPKNILIFSDGTGQSGGKFFDENRTNVYKLYRATRCGPDSPIDPLKQVSFYDRGIGTDPDGESPVPTWLRMIWNAIRQATGWGFTSNIIDCYVAIIQVWQPGDRIFLFGFSRGAYTVRCLGSVIALCGIPTHQEEGSPLKFDKKSLRKIAKKAVKGVYESTFSKNNTLKDLRLKLADAFRATYGSNLADKNESNTTAYFIGVFDTVAAVANHPIVVAMVILVLIGGVSWLVGYLAAIPFLWPFGLLVATVTGPYWRILKLRHYDKALSFRVKYVRHALSIDEHRADFDRVKWGDPATVNATDEKGKTGFEQFWFAGNHADIGGGYSENESRLSDISFRWMIEAAKDAVNGITVNEALLQTHPSPLGMQHDETKTGIFRFAKQKVRDILPGATLHHSVLERFEAKEVLNFDTKGPYRPVNLRDHKDVGKYYL